MDGNVVFGMLKVIGISMVPVAIMGAFLHAENLKERGVALGRRVHLLSPPLPPPAGPPLEKLAADLRRIRPQVVSPRPGMAMARQRGIVAAYDGVLVNTARALSVPTTLEELAETSIDREAERLRLEHALEQAGLSLQVRRP
jgi:hypothetical protein